MSGGIRLVEIAAFFFGLAFGSFINVIVLRLYWQESFISGRSYCDYCREKLSFWELIPVIGFLLLRGKCRSCKKPISLQYPLIEILSGLIWFSSFYFWRSWGQLDIMSVGFSILIFSLLLSVSVYDFKFSLIPDKIVVPAIVLTFVYNIFLAVRSGEWVFSFIYPIFAGLLFGGFFAMLFFGSGGKWIGFGDVKLMVLIGLMLGVFKGFLAIFLAFISASIFALFFLVLKRKTLKSQMVFGPFLAFALFVLYFFSSQILNFYMKLIL